MSEPRKLEIEVDVNDALERYDQSPPQLQREIVAMFLAKSTLYIDALEKIALTTRVRDLVACPGFARDVLATKVRLK